MFMCRKGRRCLFYVICTILVDVNPSVLNVESCQMSCLHGTSVDQQCFCEYH
jgi:hypothetical protein